MKYWVFDLDGTLTDSFGPYFTLVEDLIGESLSRDQKKELIGIHPSQIFKSRLPAEQATRALELLNEKSQKDAASIPLFNEIHSICTYLKKNGCRLAVWTSRDLVSAKLVLNEVGIGHYFDYIISGDCVSNRKPHSEGIEILQKLFLCEPHEMVMVGDHDHDMEAAQSFGAQPLRASWHKHWDHDNCSRSHKQFYCTSEFHQWIQSSFKKLGYI